MNEQIREVISSFIDDRGELDALDFIDVPFTPRRLFILRDIPPKTVRGEHGHFSTDQYLIVLMGEMELLIVREDGEEITSNLQKGEGIYIPKKMWIRMTFATASEVLVLASAPYSQEDYFYKPAVMIRQEQKK